jgi:hypothetical protein
VIEAFATNAAEKPFTERGRFPQLLPYPGVSRRSCHAYVDHFPGLQEGEEERKKRSKEEIGHLQEITCPDVCRVGVQERRPVLPCCWWCTNGSHVLLNGALAHLNPELKSITPNPLSSPPSISRRHFAFSTRPFLQVSSAHEKRPWTCVSRRGERAPDAI